MPDMLYDRVVLITGASGALGSAVARAFLSIGRPSSLSERKWRKPQ